MHQDAARTFYMEERDLVMEEVYSEYFGLLSALAASRFSIPTDDVPALVHDVMLSYLMARHDVEDTRAWLVGAICNACRHYWRKRTRENEHLRESDASTLQAPDPSSTDLDQIAREVTVQRLLTMLKERCRETLRLHYYEGYTANEIAKNFETTNRYAEKLIHNCLKKALELYESMSKVQDA